MKLAYTFRDPGLLDQALTHASHRNEVGGEDNERLEFLGDAVLELLVTEALEANRPTWDPGTLSKARASIVRKDALAVWGEELGLACAIRTGKGTAKEKHSRTKLVADAFEAVLGAAYRDGGLDAARGIAGPLIAAAIEGLSEEPRNPKGRLQEWLQKRGMGVPPYKSVRLPSPDHQPIFSVSVRIREAWLPPCEGSSKQAAEEAAAEAALAWLAELERGAP